MNELLQDLSYAVRQFRRAPGFTAAAVFTLALGIGANAAIFSLVDQVLLKRLPVVEPDRLVLLKYTGSDTGQTSSYGGDSQQYFSYPMYRDLRDQNTVFSGILTMFPTQVGIQWHNTPSLANSELVSGNYFSLLGVKPQVGRLFGPGDFVPGFAYTVVISDGLWHRAYGGDPHIVGRTLGDIASVVQHERFICVRRIGFDPGEDIVEIIQRLDRGIQSRRSHAPGWHGDDR